MTQEALTRLQGLAEDQRRRRREVADDLTRYRRRIKELVSKIHKLEVVIDLYIDSIKMARGNTTPLVEKAVTEAIRYAFQDQDTEFAVKFVERRGLEADYVVRINKGGLILETAPQDGDGGSLSNVVSTALKIVLLYTMEPRRRPILVLDEPEHHLQPEIRARFGQWLRELGTKLGIQVVVITHDPSIRDAADMVHELLVDDQGQVTVHSRGSRRT